MRRLAVALATLALAMPAGAAGSDRFVPNDPLAVKQWYLNAIHAFDFWPEVPVDNLAPGLQRNKSPKLAGDRFGGGWRN